MSKALPMVMIDAKNTGGLAANPQPAKLHDQEDNARVYRVCSIDPGGEVVRECMFAVTFTGGKISIDKVDSTDVSNAEPLTFEECISVYSRLPIYLDKIDSLMPHYLDAIAA